MNYKCNFTCLECNIKPEKEAMGICLSCRGFLRKLVQGECICKEGYYDNLEEECTSIHLFTNI